jgi:hypothetical protein
MMIEWATEGERERWRERWRCASIAGGLVGGIEAGCAGSANSEEFRRGCIVAGRWILAEILQTPDATPGLAGDAVRSVATD